MTEITTRDLLEGLDSRELNALRRRADWCDASYAATRADLISNINRSVTGNIQHGNLTAEQLVRQIKDDVIYLGPNKLETQIENILERTAISKVAEWSRGKTEMIACTHLYGRLQGQMGPRFDVYQEKEEGKNRRLDILLEDTDTGGEYLIEAKVGKTFSKTKLEGKLNTYHRLLDNRTKTYLLVIAFDDDYWRLKDKDKQTQKEEYLPEDMVERVEKIDRDTEVLLNLNAPEND